MTADPVMKTTADLVQEIKRLETSQGDFFGFQQSTLIGFLPFAEARPFLKDEATENDWTPNELTRDGVVKAMLDYMPFAWEKANNRRRFGAGRSIERMKAWLWILGDPLRDTLDGLYRFYGKPCLEAICEAYGWDWRQWDNGERTNG